MLAVIPPTFVPIPCQVVMAAGSAARTSADIWPKFIAARSTPFEAPTYRAVLVELAIEEQWGRIVHLLGDAGGVVEHRFEIATQLLDLAEGYIDARQRVADPLVRNLA